MSNILERLDHCIELAKTLEYLVSRDSMEMAACTRGELLTMYRSYMDQAEYQLKKLASDLCILYCEQQMLQ